MCSQISSPNPELIFSVEGRALFEVVVLKEQLPRSLQHVRLIRCLLVVSTASTKNEINVMQWWKPLCVKGMFFLLPWLLQVDAINGPCGHIAHGMCPPKIWKDWCVFFFRNKRRIRKKKHQSFHTDLIILKIWRTFALISFFEPA